MLRTECSTSHMLSEHSTFGPYAQCLCQQKTNQRPKLNRDMDKNAKLNTNPVKDLPDNLLDHLFSL